MTNDLVIVAAIVLGGLAALAVTSLLWKHGLSVRAIERALYHEATALRWQACAVASEIARRYNAGESFDRTFYTLWPLSVPLIYPATGAAAIGLLAPEARGRLGYFHAQLAAARSRLTKAEQAGGFDPTPYRILSNLTRAFYDIDPWVRALRPRLGGMIEEEPDIRAANALVSRFEGERSEPQVVAYCWMDCAYPGGA